MSVIKLYYFPVRSRGEISRLTLAAGGVEFEDIRLYAKDWQEFKKKTKYGQLPVLEVDGKQLCQGLAIQSFIAREYAGLHGSNNMEIYEIDSLANLREDLLMKESKHFLEKDESTKASLEKDLFSETYPLFATYFSNILKDNSQNNEGGFAVGKKFTLADIILYEGYSNMVTRVPDLMAKHPELLEHKKLVEGQKGIKEYLAKRPETPI